MTSEKQCLRSSAQSRASGDAEKAVPTQAMSERLHLIAHHIFKDSLTALDDLVASLRYILCTRLLLTKDEP